MPCDLTSYRAAIATIHAAARTRTYSFTTTGLHGSLPSPYDTETT